MIPGAHSVYILEHSQPPQNLFATESSTTRREDVYVEFFCQPYLEICKKSLLPLAEKQHEDCLDKNLGDNKVLLKLTLQGLAVPLVPITAKEACASPVT